MTPVDLYCERTDPSLWSEPINAITNAAFILVGLYVFSRRESPHRWELGLLGLLIVAVGLGSLAFHLAGTSETATLDVAFIALYLAVFSALLPARLWSAGAETGSSAAAPSGGAQIVWGAAGLAVLAGCIAAGEAAMAAAEPHIGWAPPGLYVGAWTALVVFVVISRLRGLAPHRVRSLAIAALIFPVSLTARQLDLPLCDSLPLGLHWLWHCLNSLVLGFTALAFRRQ